MHTHLANVTHTYIHTHFADEIQQEPERRFTYSPRIMYIHKHACRTHTVTYDRLFHGIGTPFWPRRPRSHPTTAAPTTSPPRHPTPSYPPTRWRSSNSFSRPAPPDTRFHSSLFRAIAAAHHSITQCV